MNANFEDVVVLLSVMGPLALLSLWVSWRRYQEKRNCSTWNIVSWNEESWKMILQNGRRDETLN